MDQQSMDDTASQSSSRDSRRSRPRRSRRRKRIPKDVQPEDHGYPYALVWTPIHPITWFFPFVGHLGICDSKGVIHDWGGGECNLDNMMFGNPTRYIVLRKDMFEDEEEGLSREDARAAEDWDAAVEEADDDFAQR